MKNIFPIVILGVVIVASGIAAALAWQSRPTTSSMPAVQPHYVALGDSIAAGVGLKTDSDSSACNRTDQSYSHAVASALGAQLTNIACSQATLPAGILGAQDVNKLAVTAQLDQLFAQPRPQLVSLTIGANDAGWIETIAKCYTGVCGTPADTARVTQRLATVATSLHAALTKYRDHYGANAPHLVVTGYHQVFPASGATCADLTGLDAAEQAWGRQQQSAINDTLRQAVAGFGFAVFAPVDFGGHELCAADSWVQGINDKQPYHPTEAGQAAYARQVIAAARSLK